MQRRCRGAQRADGFTLIELLVVVSIITLLISILLPSVGEVRRQARITQCTQNMKQHTLATHSYSLSNDDELPNAPRTASNMPADYGVRGRTAMKFATEDFPVNGISWGQEGIWALSSPHGYELLNNNFLDRYSSMHDLYWVMLAPYMEDGLQGAGALKDIWASPSDSTGLLHFQDLRDYARNNDGLLPSTRDYEFDDEYNLTSYRYVSAAVTDPAIEKLDEFGGGATDRADDYYFESSKLTPQLGNARGQFYDFISRNRLSDMRYSSTKVLFWMWEANHNRAEYEAWFQDGADIPVALGDGSARVTDPQVDMAPLNPIEGAGGRLVVVFDEADSDERPTQSVYRVPYFRTVSGIRGRDLR